MYDSMRMDIQYYQVRHMQFGHRTAYRKGNLTVCKEELKALLTKCSGLEIEELYIVCPGEPVRITNILDICAPRQKVGVGQDSYYPGNISNLYQAGTGITHSLRGCTVMEVGQMRGFAGGLVDMQGFGANLTPFSASYNLCVEAKPRPKMQKLEFASAINKAGLVSAVYLAGATKGQSPDEVERFELAEQPPTDDRLPRVGCLCQLYSCGNLREPIIYGARYRNYYPTVLHPNEILDGALVCGHYVVSSALKNSTHTLVHHPVILELYRRHGLDVDFRGVVIAPEPTTLTEIQRTAKMSASLLKHTLGVEGVIITKEGGGHTTVDLMANCDACEALGIRTVLIDNEWLGPNGNGELSILDMTPNADAMVNIGNIDEIVPLGAMDIVIGGYKMPEVDGDLRHSIEVPIRCIPEAVSQLGGGNLRSKSCEQRGMKRNVVCDKPASSRAAEMLLSKLSGRSWETEIPFPECWPGQVSIPTYFSSQ